MEAWGWAWGSEGRSATRGSRLVPFFEEIWRGHVTGRSLGDYFELRPDLVYGHEGTLALILPELRKHGGPRMDVGKLFWVVDHFAPPSSGEHADIVSDMAKFCNERGIELRRFEGIGHRLMLESDLVKPGSLVLGADSHTTTIGGKGALGIGLGSTDILAVLMTGTVWLRRPEVAQVRLTGSWAPWTEPKDLVLSLLRDHGQDGFLGTVIEFLDESDTPLSVEQGAVLCNMTVEMGAVSGLMIPGDAAQTDTSKIQEKPSHGAKSKIDPTSHEATSGQANRKSKIASLSALAPLVARPGSPADVVPADSLSGVRVDTVHVGSCASGGLEDLETAARLLAGRRVSPGVTLLVTPATRSILAHAVARGVVAPLLDAGAVLLNPSCGACGGIDKGIPGKGEVVVSTGPRNYGSRLRVGSQVYLASTATAVASAITGRITSPPEVAR